MADENDPIPTNLTTNQISTTDLVAAPVPAPAPVADLGDGAAPAPDQTGAVEPAPSGTVPGAEPGAGTDVAEDTKEGVGTDGEVLVWEGRYSMKNFLGRLIFWGLMTLAWLALAVYAWGGDEPRTSIRLLAVVAGIVVLFMVAGLIYRIILARYGHFYRLTTRRLFVSSGLYRRRRDMTELLKVDDVYTRQTLSQRFLSIGTVVVVSSDQKLPVSYLPGVNDPKGVMDTIWHYARAERDRKSVKIDHV